MDRSEAEAIYDSGRERCVGVILELAGAVERLGTRCEQLEDRVRRLEEQLRKDSRNSSAPPSQDPPKTRAERRAEARRRAKEWSKREGERRKPGGQPGHKGSGRKLLPEDQVDEIVDHYPDACGGCGRGFTDDERQSTRFGRHQVAELPPIVVIFTEHRTHRLRCPGCGNRTAAKLPAGIGDSPFGSDLHAAVVTLTARNRVSRRDMSELAWELFGLELSVGAVDAICQRAAEALEAPHEQLVEQVLASPAVNVDETGWFTAHEGRTMWTVTTPDAAIFRIVENRHRDRLEELIKNFKGILGSDRWWAYDYIDPESRQACWEHLKRDFFKHSQGLAEQKEFGTAGLALTKRLFKAWHSFQEHHDRERLIREMKMIQDELRALLEHAGRKSPRTRHHRRFANNLLKIWPALWTFVTVDAVDPTNNAAERALRGPVIYRKLSHGTQSHDGERFIERALSASVTCRLQAPSMLAYMRELHAAHSPGDPLPTHA
jgi:transposase